MTYKVQKIREEVERLQNELIQERQKGYGSDVDNACILELQNVLTYIDSLQEEPVSEELEEFALQYAGHHAPYDSCMQEVEDAVKAGAEWGKNQAMAKIQAQSMDLAHGCPEENKSEDLKKAADNALESISDQYDIISVGSCLEMFKLGAKWQEEKDRISNNENLEKAAKKEAEIVNALGGEFPSNPLDMELIKTIFIHGAKWQKAQEYTCYEEAFEDGAKWKIENLWKPADGDDLPEIDREVVVFTQNFIDDAGMMRVAIGHRPNPDGWDGKSLTSGKVEHYTPKTYDKDGWNIPDVKYWLDCCLPKEEDEL